ncbi:MAG: DMT family transporter [Defluviimonas denitrificans]
MATIPMTAAADRTLAAAAAILGYAIIIGFTDNFVRVIAADAGLWQFHALRGVMAMAILGVAARPLGLRLAPRNLRAVAGRSLIHGCAMLIYFGCLAFLPVATVAAGLFTAPIFVLLISRFAFGHPVGPYRIAAVLIGFLGVILVLGPASGERIGAATVLPVAAGALYALGNLATREWCAGETAETLLAGFFVTLGLFGVIGMIALALWPVPVPEGAAGFVLRGATDADRPLPHLDLRAGRRIADRRRPDDPRLPDRGGEPGRDLRICHPARQRALVLPALGRACLPPRGTWHGADLPRRAYHRPAPPLSSAHDPLTRPPLYLHPYPQDRRHGADAGA